MAGGGGRGAGRPGGVSADDYLDRLSDLIDRVDPVLVSDHLCFSSGGGVHAHDLLPLPYTDEALDHVVTRLQRVQQRLGRAILIENPSGYVAFAGSAMAEAELLAEAARRSGCGILLDLNNVFVSAGNLGLDAGAYRARCRSARCGSSTSPAT